MTMIVAILFIRVVLVVAILHVTYGRTVPQPTSKMRGGSLPPCPPSCTCFQNDTVACDGMRLTQVPSDLPIRTRALYLNHNHLDSLNIQALLKLKDLEVIHLRGSKINEVHVRRITSLPQLRHLDLRGNSVVCNCNMARLIENAWDNSKLHIQLGNTECSSPKNHCGKKAVGVLSQLQCRTRDRRHAEDECIIHDICKNGGTCQIRGGLPFCICPVGFIGVHCELPQNTPHGSGGNGDASLDMQMRESTHNSITITWATPSGVVKFLVSLYYYHETHHNPAVWTTSTRYTFNGLQPATRYELCVSAYAAQREMLTEECEVYQTRAMPPPGTSPGSNKPGGPDHNEEPSTDGYDGEKVIKKAAIILGSIIGVCALLVVFLTLVHKFRPFRGPRQNTRPPSTAAEASPGNAADSEGIPAEENHVANQVDHETTRSADSGREIFVVSVSAPESAPMSLVDRGGPPGVLLPGEPSTSTPESSALQDVLRAIKNSTSQPSRGSSRGSNPMVLYHPNNNGSPVPEHRGSSLTSASGNAPIFILSDGTQYPLDSSLSNVLRNAMGGPGSQQLPPPPAHPQEPPPPYSETPEEDMVSLPQEAATLAPSAPPEFQFQPNENCEMDATSLVESQEEN